MVPSFPRADASVLSSSLNRSRGHYSRPDPNCSLDQPAKSFSVKFSLTIAQENHSTIFRFTHWHHGSVLACFRLPRLRTHNQRLLFTIIHGSSLLLPHGSVTIFDLHRIFSLHLTPLCRLVLFYNSLSRITTDHHAFSDSDGARILLHNNNTLPNRTQYRRTAHTALRCTALWDNQPPRPPARSEKGR